MVRSSEIGGGAQDARSVPTAPSRILEGHKDLLTFRAQLEHIRFLVLRMGGNVLSDRQGADTPQERSRSTVAESCRSEDVGLRDLET